MSAAARPWLLGGAAALTLLLAPGCRPAPPPTPTPHAVHYRLAWATDGVVRSADGTAVEITSDLGYRIRLRRGWITSYSMELVECPKEASSWLVGTAFAGHSAGTPNPAAIRPMQVESFLDPAEREVGVVTLAPQAYCKVHYLVARAGHDSPGLPAELDMVDTTLHLDGSYAAPGATAETAFAVHTASAYGQLFERAAGSAAALRVDPGRDALVVTVRRHLAHVFDGVDFATMTEKAVALQILRSLVDHVEIEIGGPVDAHG